MMNLKDVVLSAFPTNTNVLLGLVVLCETIFPCIPKPINILNIHRTHSFTKPFIIPCNLIIQNGAKKIHRPAEFRKPNKSVLL